jgi:hypothetical protein
MTTRFRRAGLVLLAAGCLTLSATAATVAPEIKDDGKFFSPDAVKKADARIREIASKHDFDVLVETFPTPPADQVEKVKELDAKGRAEFFSRWAKERSDHRVVHGIYILACQEPKHLFIGVTKRGMTAFPPEVRKQLTEMLIGEFRKARFDEGLDAALTFIEDRLGKGK